MYRVLVVDDEPHVRQSLAMTIPWETQTCVVVGSAGSGAEALVLFESLRPDLVFTDIRMPGIDGLTLAGLLRKRSSEVPVIILSGHSDFEYARRAIDAGAFGYCLKPFDEAEILGMAAKACRKVAEGRATPQPDLGRALAAWPARGILPTKERPAHVLVTRAPARLPEAWETAAVRLDRCCLGFVVRGVARTEFRQWLEGSALSAGTWAAVEDCACDLAEVFTSLQNQVYGAYAGRQAQKNGRDFRPALQSIVADLQAGEVGRVRAALEVMGSQFLAGEGTMADLTLVLQTVHSVLESLVPRSVGDALGRDQVATDYPDSSAALAALQDRLTGFSNQLSLQHVQRAGSGAVKRILSFLLANYHRPLHLAEVAHECHLSETYVSAVFSKETGHPLMAYLNKIRVEQACRLIRETNYSMEDIAARVGFASYVHFYRVFRAQTGLAPGAYRRPH